MADYENHTVAELKVMLKQRGIPLSGMTRKYQYVEALNTNDTEGGDGDEVADDANDVEDTGDVEETDAPAEAKDTSDQAAPANATGDPPPEETTEPTRLVEEDVTHHNKTTESASAAAGINELDPITADAQQQDHVAVSPTTANANAQKNNGVDTSPADAEVEEFTNATSNPQSAEDVAPIDNANSDSRKRKRRSLTPPISEELVHKKLKAAEDKAGVDVKLPEDAVPEDSMQPDNDVQDANEDDRMQDDEHDDAAQIKLSPLTTDSVHPPTRAVYICQLVRPFRSEHLRDHLAKISKDANSDDEQLTDFWVDTFRSHAFATFESVAAALRVRSALHGTQWPDEHCRKRLIVDFVPPEKVRGWIEVEETGVKAARDALEVKHWEIIYTSLGSKVLVTHEEYGPKDREVGVQKTLDEYAAQRAWKPRAPTVPASSPQRAARVPAPSSSNADTPTQEQRPTVFDALAQHFSFTESKPKIYYKPVSEELADRRLHELDKLTARDWHPRRGFEDPGPGAALRRFTYDDGDRLVDGGPEQSDLRSRSGPGLGRGGGGRGGFGRGGRGGGFGRRGGGGGFGRAGGEGGFGRGGGGGGGFRGR